MRRGEPAPTRRRTEVVWSRSIKDRIRVRRQPLYPTELWAQYAKNGLHGSAQTPRRGHAAARLESRWRLSPQGSLYSMMTAATYQRSRLPPPPPPRPPRSRPPPPPPPPLRSVFGRASLTLMVRPPTCDPFNAVMAFSPSSLLAISTNPKPRERPVSRSVMMLTRSTCPYDSNICRSSSSLVLKLRFPTKIFFTLMPLH